MLADFPPSSRPTGVRCSSAARGPCAPWRRSRWKWILSTPRWRHSASPPSGPLGTTLTTPGGNPASRNSWPISSAAVRRELRGLMTTQLPAASAGAAVIPMALIGPFHGMMMATTPVGLRAACSRARAPARSAPPRRRSVGPPGVVTGNRSAALGGHCTGATVSGVAFVDDVELAQPVTVLVEQRGGRQATGRDACRREGPPRGGGQLVQRSPRRRSRRCLPAGTSPVAAPGGRVHVPEPSTTRVGHSPVADQEAPAHASARSAQATSCCSPDLLPTATPTPRGAPMHHIVMHYQ